MLPLGIRHLCAFSDTSRENECRNSEYLQGKDGDNSNSSGRYTNILWLGFEKWWKCAF